MSKGYIPFGVVHKGKCSRCRGMKPLDEMIKENAGLYHCIDCEVDALNATDLSEYNIFPPSEIPMSVEDTKIKKLLAWCFG